MQYHLGVFRMLLIGFFMAQLNLSQCSLNVDGAEVGGRNYIKHHHQRTNAESLIRTVESRLLKVFGLKTRPRPKRDVPVPEYMVNLYRSQVESGREWTEEDTVRDLAVHQLHSGSVLSSLNTNTARSFVASPLDTKKKAEELGDPNDLRLWFNVTSIPIDELSRAAELRVFRLKGRRCAKHKSAHLQIYDIIRPSYRTRVLKTAGNVTRPVIVLEEPLLRLLDTRVLDWRQDGWEAFDVLPALSRWREDSTRNHGLLLKIVSSDGTKKCPQLRIAGSNSVGERQPILVTYTDDGRGPTPLRTSRVKRNTRKHRRKGRKNNCRRQSLYVDFNDVGWNDWIVAPPGYHAYLCNGECPFPLADHMNSTNHAIVQTLVNSVNPKAVPRACCVPTELSPISLLYVDEYEKVVLKNYQDMVVEGCGCR